MTDSPDDHRTRCEGPSKLAKSFLYVVNGVPKWVAAGIFESLCERLAAAQFPLFGKRLHEPRTLQQILEKYRLNKITTESLELSVRTAGCLKRASIETLDTVLMMYPFQLLEIKNLGSKSVHELQEVAQAYLEIEVEISRFR